MRRALAIAWMGCWAIACMPPDWGAEAILRPPRRALDRAPDVPYEDVAFTASDGAVLRGWLFRATGVRRRLLVYLHGIGDNRQGGLGIARRFGPRGWDVLAYDARAHGASGGTACTYGVLETADLLKAIDSVSADRVVLFGCSLGAAVALQAAPLDSRIRGVIAQSSFSSLAEIARDRAPWFATAREVDRALKIAGEKGGFDPAAASPVAAAAGIRVPVLLIHGRDDRETRPDHSRRIEAALAAPKRMIVVAGAGHDDTLRGDSVWTEVEGFLAAHDLGRSGG
ncbi:MAG TPA: alpha/beta fold hydrolase [Vicinamibacteria bacterium]|nr:alpha/beta fold hydrolase [Vicinamibacteria bacterium]